MAGKRLEFEGWTLKHTADPLEAALKKEFEEAVRVCMDRYGYRPSYFLRMLRDYGAVETAVRLVTAPKVHEGLIKL
jgi:hypothetical protein